jgi:two-component sensor histidine kinase
MKRLAHFDVSSGLSSRATRLLARCGLGALCGVAMIVLRTAVDMAMPGVGAFAFVFPAVLLATLYGRWEAGLVAYAVSFFWAWNQVLPMDFTAPATDQHQLARVIVNGAAALIVLLFAETFRGAVEHERSLRDAEIERRALLLAELEHRTKNNFALVASLLELQKRREPSDLVRVAFDDAIGRVRTFSEAYTHLAGEQGEGAAVEMRPYLERLVARICSALLPPNVTVRSHFAEIGLPRETAVAIGLFANEVLTNCAKYAFPNGRPGTVEIMLAAEGETWRLIIRDDGVGDAAPLPPHAGGGIGSKLLAAFARQARARHATSYAGGGCEVSLIHGGAAEQAALR